MVRAYRLNGHETNEIWTVTSDVDNSRSFLDAKPTYNRAKRSKPSVEIGCETSGRNGKEEMQNN